MQCSKHRNNNELHAIQFQPRWGVIHMLMASLRNLSALSMCLQSNIRSRPEDLTARSAECSGKDVRLAQMDTLEC